MSIIATIAAKAISTPIIGAIVKPIAEGLLSGYKAKLENQTSQASIAADLAKRELDVEQREREVNANIIVAEQGNFLTRSVRPVWAFPFICYTYKVVIYDQMMGWGSTPELKGFIAWIGVAIVTAYFGGRSAEKIVARIWPRK